MKTITEDTDWKTASLYLKQTELEANYLNGPGQRWCILPPGRFNKLRVLDGKDLNIKGRKGIVTDLNGAYFVELLGPGRVANTVRFRNKPQEGRQPVPLRTDEIELDLIYPLIKGAQNIKPFLATTSPLYVIVPNRGISQTKIPLASEMVRRCPGAMRYFREINAKGIMNQRSTWRTRMAPQYQRMIQQQQMETKDVPFYAIYDVGEYTFAEHKVVWAEMAGTISAAVVSKGEVPHGGGPKPIVPDHKVYFAPFDDILQAHYVCASLNSDPVRTFIDGLTIKIQVGTVFRHIHLPKFEPKNTNHYKLAQLSLQAHREQVTNVGRASISVHLKAINKIVEEMLRLTVDTS